MANNNGSKMFGDTGYSGNNDAYSLGNKAPKTTDPKQKFDTATLEALESKLNDVLEKADKDKSLLSKEMWNTLQKKLFDLQVTAAQQKLTLALKGQSELDAITAARELENLQKQKEAKDELVKAEEKITEKLLNAASGVVSQINSAVDSFVNKQEMLSYGLIGTGTTISEISSSMARIFSAQGIVKLDSVYNKLTEYIRGGIVSNAQQLAFLYTLKDDLGMYFDPENGTVMQLAEILKDTKSDISAEKMAIEYSLKEFLNNEYETSRYIASSFQSVSNALLQMQAISGSTAEEAIIQKYLGAFSSSGGGSNATSTLATLIGALGSGDLSKLNGGASNLLVMGASQAGLSYADMLINGLTEETTSRLMEGVFSYIGSLQSGNNVITSALANIYGIEVTDIIAAGRMMAESANLSSYSISNNVGNLLENVGDLIPSVKQLSNLLSNFESGVALDISRSTAEYAVWKTSLLASEILGNVSKVAKYAPYALVGAYGIGNVLGSAYEGTAFGGADDIWNALTGSLVKSGYKGTLGSRSSGTDASFSGSSSGNNGASSGTDINTYAGTAQDRDINDIYTLLEKVNEGIAVIPDTEFAATVGVAPNSSIKISNDLSTIQDMLTFTAMNVHNIYLLLFNQMNAAGITYEVKNASTGGFTNQYEWMTPNLADTGTGL